MPTLTLPSLSVHELRSLGLKALTKVHYQLPPEDLIQDCLRRKEGRLAGSGALVVHTGEFTGRSPKDKFIVLDQGTRNDVHWNEFNQPISQENFDRIHQAITSYLADREEIWVMDSQACADPAYRINIRVACEKPWTALFVHNMLLRPGGEAIEGFRPDWQILCAPGLRLDPEFTGTRQHNAAVISFSRRMVLIAGTGYTGETKKGIFTILNYLLPLEHGVLSMHCSANTGVDGDTALFFGLSGTGKTTLSADPDRMLIGDDEHGWDDKGIFNLEGGCYAKCIHLSEEKEPQIFQAIRNGALVENVTFRPGTSDIDFGDASVTENTRVSYPLHHIANARQPATGPHPEHIFFLTCDALGILPPLSRLTPGQAMFQFISGYTARVAGTETGVTEPKTTFSACFGAPFLPLHPGMYADMLGRKLRTHGTTVWLVNTGWTGGPYGVGDRISLRHTRALIHAVLDGKMELGEFENFPIFNLSIPKSCHGLPSTMLNPINTWADKDAFHSKARELATLFNKNFEKYSAGVSREVLDAAPVF